MNARSLSLSAFGLVLAAAPLRVSPVHTEDGAHFVVSGAANTARYRVRERLAGRAFDNDAVGRTTSITGSVTLDQAGAVVPAASKITVDLTSLVSDSQRRDRYVRSRILGTDSFPSASIEVTGVSGLPTPLPESGPLSFHLQGNLSLRGVTRPTAWNVDAAATGGSITGRATTKFTFADFKLNQPTVAVLLSVADTITLEYDFAIQRVSP